MTLRPANISDTLSIAELVGQLGYTADATSLKNRLEFILKQKRHCVFVVSENEKLIGWIHGFYSLRIESEFFTEIGGLVVHEEHRKKGLGKILVEQVSLWAEENSFGKLRVRCNSIRQESHQFYEKIGFELIKEQKIYDK